MNILIIKQTSLGDVLNSTVAIKILKNNFPDSKITFLIDETAYDIIRYNKDVDKIIVFNLKLLQENWIKKPNKVYKHIKRIIKEVREIDYDVAFDLQGLFRSVFFLYLAKAKKKYIKGRWILLKGFRNKYLHAIDEILKVLKLANLNIENPKMKIYTSKIEQEKINTFFSKKIENNKKTIIISPFTRWKSKNWGTHNYNRLLKLIKQEYNIIFTGTKDKIKETKEIFIDIKPNNVYNMVGKLNILELAELLKQSDLLITGDSFPAHLGGSVNIPIIEIFGPTDENRVGPMSDNSIVLRDNIICQKCYKKVCPKNNICMDNVKPEMVYNSIKKIIN